MILDIETTGLPIFKDFVHNQTINDFGNDSMYFDTKIDYYYDSSRILQIAYEINGKIKNEYVQPDEFLVPYDGFPRYY